MGEVLAELERVLRLDPKETITLEEELVLQKCKTRAVNSFLTGAGVSSALVWGATKRRFGTASRVSFSIGGALLVGGWTFDRSLNSSVQRILSAHGTRMQRELSRIIMSKNLQNPSSPVSKVFYPEHVYDDSRRDKPFVRWRTRNFYQDNPISDSVEDASLSPANSNNCAESASAFRNGGAENVVGLEDIIADPLDCVLGGPDWSRDEASQSKAGNIISRRKVSAHKRHRQRLATRHDRNSSFSGSPKALSA